MRVVALAHWQLFTWHLPSALLACVGLLVAVRMSTRLLRGEYGADVRARRWRIIGWCVLWSTLFTPILWPYFRAPARVTVDEGGTWHLTNYLGMPIADVAASELRVVRGVDLGGRGVGMGVLEIERADGSVLRSVRMNRDTLRTFLTTLGYAPEDTHTHDGDLVLPAHRYTPRGPEGLAASRSLQ